MGLNVFLFKQRESTSCYTVKTHILLNDSTMLLSLLFVNRALSGLSHFPRHYIIFQFFFLSPELALKTLLLLFLFLWKQEILILNSVMRDGSMIKNMYCPFRGLGFGSQHPPIFVSGYGGYDAVLCPYRACTHTKTYTHSDT